MHPFKIISILLFLINTAMAAQNDTTFYNAKGQKVKIELLPNISRSLRQTKTLKSKRNFIVGEGNAAIICIKNCLLCEMFCL